MITRFELIATIIKNEGHTWDKINKSIYRLFAHMSDYEFTQWYYNHFGHKLTIVRKNLYF